jgi:ferrochelatase
MSTAVLLASHGTVDRLDDLHAFVTNVRRGQPPPDDLVAELRRRYEAIGGSPLNAINDQLARRLAERSGLTVAWANRLWRPYVADRIAELAASGVRRLVLLPLAQHSAQVYAEGARGAAAAHGLEMIAAANWGRRADLCAAFATRILRSLRESPAPERTALILTAHSLPKSVVDAGDPYEREVRAAAQAIAAAVVERGGRTSRVVVAFQSQGMASGRPIAWLGPDLPSALDEVQRGGDRHVVVAPHGFLADHVEILYDLDVEARALAAARGLSFARAESLNADDDFVEVLARLVEELVSGGGPSAVEGPPTKPSGVPS